ncbi:hypothetical protein Goshw_007752 [Gossypium schwendimanii]|uniref:Uncharacterized protein n=1 Tax=Gossypium schwendimanii TaxID=34291 RepID=A0A7J9MG95_GOSSC|nr:hypothetical protein [Gossypium schwendimanii]
MVRLHCTTYVKLETSLVFWIHFWKLLLIVSKMLRLRIALLCILQSKTIDWTFSNS